LHNSLYRELDVKRSLRFYAQTGLRKYVIVKHTTSQPPISSACFEKEKKGKERERKGKNRKNRTGMMCGGRWGGGYGRLKISLEKKIATK
jgi:hypothetical protein